MYEDVIDQLDRVEVPQTHQLSARYGINFFDGEALAVSLYGDDKAKLDFQEKRSREFNDKVEKAIGTKLSNLARI
jgi:hypothetical protein